MSSNKKPTETSETNLRRSTRSTRGSVKPVVDLVKVEQEAEEPETKEVKKETQAEVKKETKTRAKKQTTKKREEVIEIKDELDSDDYNEKDEQVEQIAVPDDDDNEEEEEEDEAEIDNDDDDDDEDFEEPKSKRASSRGKTKVSAKKPKVKNEKTKESKTTKGKEVKKETKKEELDDVEIYYELNEKEMKEVNDAFDMNCTEDGEEQLSSDDLKTAIRALGFEPRVDEIKKLVEKFGSQNGKVNRNGFHKIMAFKMGSTPGTNDNASNDEISRVFNLLDLDRTGVITLENLKSISKELNEDITDEELHEMIAEADLDGDFMINKQEFYNIMKKTSLY